MATAPKGKTLSQAARFGLPYDYQFWVVSPWTTLARTMLTGWHLGVLYAFGSTLDHPHSEPVAHSTVRRRIAAKRTNR